MFKQDFFFFKVFVLLSIFHTVTFPTPVGTFRLLHFGIPIMLYFIITHGHWSMRMRKYRNVFLFLLLFLLYGGATYFNSVYQNGTVRILCSTILNSIVFFYFVLFLEKYKEKTKAIMAFIKKFVKILCVMVILQWCGGLVHAIPISQPGEGLLAVGRPGVFFEDPNWCGYFILFLHIMVEATNEIWQVKTDKRYRILVFIALLFMQSRILLLCWLFHYIYYIIGYKNKWIFLPFILVTLLLFIDTSILRQILPERFLYDIVNADNNPRLNDIENITSEVKNYHRETFGMGWGSLAKIADNYPWRSYDITINVFPAQIYFDFGNVGYTIFIILTIITLIRIKGSAFKFGFVFFILNCCFHMPGYFIFSWVLLAMYTFLYKNRITLNSL